MKQEDKQKLMNRLVNLGITALDAVACSYDSLVRQQADMHAMNVLGMIVQLDGLKNDDEEEKRTAMLEDLSKKVAESWKNTFSGFGGIEQEPCGRSILDVGKKQSDCVCAAERIIEER